MNKETRTHYRSVFKSDHLGTPDLEEMIEEGKRLVFTIKNVKQEYGTRVAGRKIDANIAYFAEKGVKPMVLNATNSKQISKFTGSKFVEDWNNVPVELFVDKSVTMKGEVVGGVRIKPTQPKLTKPTLDPKHTNWEKAKAAVKEGKATIEGIRKNYTLSKEDEALLTA